MGGLIRGDSFLPAGGFVDQIAPYTAKIARQRLDSLRDAVKRNDREDVLACHRMTANVASNLRIIGLGEAADMLRAEAGKMVSEHFASGVNGGGRDG